MTTMYVLNYFPIGFQTFVQYNQLHWPLAVDLYTTTTLVTTPPRVRQTVYDGVLPYFRTRLLLRFDGPTDKLINRESRRVPECYYKA